MIQLSDWMVFFSTSMKLILESFMIANPRKVEYIPLKNMRNLMQLK